MRIDLHVYHHADPEVVGLRGFISDLIVNLQETLMATKEDVLAKMNAIATDVADEATVIGSVEQLLTNMAAEIAALKDAATHADVPAEIVDKIDALSQAVAGNKSRLAADVVANTPAA